MVDGQAHTGWLTDTDGKRYFFDDSGIMKTGWVDDGGKRYFMDLTVLCRPDLLPQREKVMNFWPMNLLKGYKAPEKKKDNKKASEQTKAPKRSLPKRGFRLAKERNTKEKIYRPDF